MRDVQFEHRRDGDANGDGLLCVGAGVKKYEALAASARAELKRGRRDNGTPEA